MTIRIALAILISCLLGAPAGAQPADNTSACKQDGYDPTFAENYPSYSQEEWPKEAKRFANNRWNVSREGRRLRLRLDNGKSVELVDCPFTDTANGYLYQSYDRDGRFYVVEQPMYEDHYYVLVMKKTGKIYRFLGPPVWAEDKSRFLTVRCAVGFPVNTLAVHALSGDAIATEVELDMPCATCSAHWDNPSSIAVTCKQLSGPDGPKPDTLFAVRRGSDGTWKRADR
jgi:hypothetical protein